MSEEIYDELNRMAHMYAEAEAERIYLVEFRKSKKALLMKAAAVKDPKMSGVNQEREAYAHNEYLELIKGLQYATEKSLLLKHKVKVIEMRFEAWRSKNATKRAEMNLR